MVEVVMSLEVPALSNEVVAVVMCFECSLTHDDDGG